MAGFLTALGGLGTVAGGVGRTEQNLQNQQQLTQNQLGFGKMIQGLGPDYDWAKEWYKAAGPGSAHDIAAVMGGKIGEVFRQQAISQQLAPIFNNPDLSDEEKISRVAAITGDPKYLEEIAAAKIKAANAPPHKPVYTMPQQLAALKNDLGNPLMPAPMRNMIQQQLALGDNADPATVEQLFEGAGGFLKPPVYAQRPELIQTEIGGVPQTVPGTFSPYGGGWGGFRSGAGFGGGAGGGGMGGGGGAGGAPPGTAPFGTVVGWRRPFQEREQSQVQSGVNSLQGMRSIQDQFAQPGFKEKWDQPVFQRWLNKEVAQRLDILPGTSDSEAYKKIQADPALAEYAAARLNSASADFQNTKEYQALTSSDPALAYALSDLITVSAMAKVNLLSMSGSRATALLDMTGGHIFEPTGNWNSIMTNIATLSKVYNRNLNNLGVYLPPDQRPTGVEPPRMTPPKNQPTTPKPPVPPGAKGVDWDPVHHAWKATY